MKPIKITDRNVMFTQPMNERYDLNMGLILGKKHNFIIDTGLGSGSVKPVIEFIGNSKKPVVVINTHYHWDHVWGNFMFKDSLIIGHPLCCKLQDKHWDEMVKDNRSAIDGEMRKCLVNITFEGTLHFPDDEITIFTSIGHSGDDISVYDTVEKVLYAGDNIGDTEDEIIPWISTDFETFKSLIELYKKYDFDYCIAGHNKPQTKEVLARMEAALSDAWDKQQKGKTDCETVTNG